ncbi:MAG: hypothetical protein WCW66_05915 [Patescibacteria group bacterium]
MKKISFGIAICAFVLFQLSQPAQAKIWRSPSYPYGDLVVGHCILVDTISEADDTHVYTLNPDNTTAINFEYYEHWNRNARCDELQFHVDHNTPIIRLREWLRGVAIGWYQNIGTSHFKNQTVSTPSHEWFFIDEAGAHRIPDWLTALSWGLLMYDRISIGLPVSGDFHKYVKFSTPLNFGDGNYADKVSSIWLENDTDYSTLPNRLVEEINRKDADSSYPVLGNGVCTYPGTYPGDPYRALLDWGWMLRNPGCPMAN